jgi:hypothetical protein
VADLRTTVTELTTGLGMLGLPSLDAALAARAPAMVSMSPAEWDRLAQVHEGGALAAEFAGAWENGRAFLHARDGLRGRTPLTVEWKGSHRAPGDEVAPIDLRVDHVYLVSCKYLSRILINPSPAHLFDRLLRGGHGVRSPNWYHEVAPAQYQALYEAARAAVPGLGLPALAADLTRTDAQALAPALAGRDWPVADAAVRYLELADAVSAASAARWRAALHTTAEREAMLWRLLRIGSTPYFVLGSGAGRAGLRLRVATAWDWRRHFELRSFDVAPEPGGQARVGWHAVVRRRDTATTTEVRGHVEVRWSHGRFAAPPEAKVYLDTPHAEVPGYFPLV